MKPRTATSVTILILMLLIPGGCASTQNTTQTREQLLNRIERQADAATSIALLYSFDDNHETLPIARQVREAARNVVLLIGGGVQRDFEGLLKNVVFANLADDERFRAHALWSLFILTIGTDFDMEIPVDAADVSMRIALGVISACNEFIHSAGSTATAYGDGTGIILGGGDGWVINQHLAKLHLEEE